MSRIHALYHLMDGVLTASRSIMKARKTMKNQQLIQEVIAQISQRFAPKLPDIKKVCLSPIHPSIVLHSLTHVFS